MAENKQFGISEQLDDTISRAAVVDAIEGVDWYHINKNGEMVHGANDNDHQAWYKAEDIYKAVESVPPAQPVAKDINVSVKDCISRQAAIDALAEWQDAAITNRLNNLPSAQQWIPCSERLPGDDEEVIVSCTDDSGDYSLDYTTVGWHYKGLWVVNNERSYFVRAWMPLPEPYKEDADD